MLGRTVNVNILIVALIVILKDVIQVKRKTLLTKAALFPTNRLVVEVVGTCSRGQSLIPLEKE